MYAFAGATVQVPGVKVRVVVLMQVCILVPGCCVGALTVLCAMRRSRPTSCLGWQKPLFQNLGEVVFVFLTKKPQKPLVFWVFGVVFAQHEECSTPVVR
jgi:hypothetical protein